MKLIESFLVILFLTSTTILSRRSNRNSKNNVGHRQGKLFSLFNIVTFNNEVCTSTAGNNRQGICYTSNECSSNNGQASGNCAAGFGICCIFDITATSGNINQNLTHLRNPNFPNSPTAVVSQIIMVNKCSCDVCALRLDFDQFQIETTDESTCRDSFSVTTTSFPGNSLPVLCGNNQNQHIYVDMGADCNDMATLHMITNSAPPPDRRWDIKISQIECTSSTLPPSGCFQYHTTTSGQIKSFNFDQTTNPSHLFNQDYGICIRQSEGFCCVEYSVCEDANSFTLHQYTNANTGKVDSSCTNTHDFIVISGASDICNNAAAGTTVTRICGNKFTNVNTDNKAMDISICDCSQPFDIFVRTNNVKETEATAANPSRGFCLNYRQIPCTTA